MPDVALKPMADEDLEAAAALHGRCFPDQPWDAKAFRDLLSGPGVTGLLALGDKGSLEGLLLLRAVADEAEVLTICVAPERRRIGLGRDLLRAGLVLLGEAGARRVFLEVAEDNAGAAALYRGEGFEQIAERRNYYKRDDSQVTARLLHKLIF